MDTASTKRKAKRKSDSICEPLSTPLQNIDKKYSEMPSIYAGSEEKLLNLVVEIIIKIILKEVL